MKILIPGKLATLGTRDTTMMTNKQKTQHRKPKRGATRQNRE
jgi:hypothetical protein